MSSPIATSSGAEKRRSSSMAATTTTTKKRRRLTSRPGAAAAAAAANAADASAAQKRKRPALPRRLALKQRRSTAKRARREERERERERLGAAAPPKAVPRTIENTREPEPSHVESDDEEVAADEAADEMAAYFAGERTPKVLITTSPRAKVKTWKLCFELRKCIPNAELFSRKGVAIKRIVREAKEHNFTDLVIVHEDHKEPNGLVLCHLPDGPTAYFKLQSLKYTAAIKGAGESTGHHPEVVLNNFTTRLGHSVARMFACLFPQAPMFEGRRVVTFHNQRDYIFFRHHRYEFKERESGEKAALHELGPRFTLRLKWLQRGTYDSREGEYEWVLKRKEMETSRRRFVL